MRENICTIPVNEIFEERCGCPLCRMRNKIEEKYVDYITGAAMMEPDIRVMTNASGFCERHFSMMIFSNREKLPIALMLSTHVEHIEKEMLAKTDKKSLEKLQKLEDSCFVCDYLNRHFERHIDTMLRNYKNEADFRALYAQQDYLCLPHYRMLAQAGVKPLGKLYPEFLKVTHDLVMKAVSGLETDFKGFTDAFDYRNAGKPMPEPSKTVVERSVEFLTSRKPVKK